jgi:hypothetical protein
VFDGISNLGAKSLIIADVTGEDILFRLLDTTRAYALEKLEACDESAMIRRRHAELCCADWSAAETQAPGTADWVRAHGRKIDDIRAALGWCFSPEGDASIGVRLTAASAPLWIRFSVMDEYRRHLERALRALEADPTPNATVEMKLNAMLGHALIYTSGSTRGVDSAFNRALEIADLLGDTVVRWRALWGLGLARLVSGDYSSAVDFSERALLDSVDCDDDAPVMSDRLLAVVHHFAGNQTSARHHVERVLNVPIRTKPALSSDNWVTARAILSRILWVQGLPDQALRAAHDSVEDGSSAHHALSACQALTRSCAVVLWAGDVPAANRLVAMLLDVSARHSLSYYHAWGRCFDAALELRYGDAEETLRRRHALLRDPLFTALHLETLGTLSEELVGAEAIARAETGRAGWCTAELLRAKGEIILKEGASDAAFEAEILFRRSLEMARRQGTLSWELRAATSLARLWRHQGRIQQAHDLMVSVYGRFTEGFGTADLVTAKTLLAELAV